MDTKADDNTDKKAESIMDVFALTWVPASMDINVGIDAEWD